MLNGFKRLLIAAISVSLITGLFPISSLAVDNNTYTRIVYNFDDESQNDLDSSIASKGYAPGAKQTFEFAKDVGVNNSTALKMMLKPDDQTSTNYALVHFRRAFMAYAKAGDTIDISVFIPEGQSIKSLRLSTKTGDGFPEKNQQSDVVNPQSGDFLSTNQWYHVYMTLKETTTWPSGEFYISLNYKGDSYIYIDDCTVKGNTPNVPYVPYIGKKAETFKDVSPMEAVKAMNPGWNLGNVMDMENEGKWNNLPAEQKIFPFIKKEGFNSLRLPVMWGEHLQKAPDYKIEQEWLDRVERLVDWALDEDLYVMLNTHHDSGWITAGLKSSNPDEVDAAIDKLCKVWGGIAERFKWKSEKLQFEVMNEVDAPNNDMIDRVNQAVLDTIRKSGGYNDKRDVVIGGKTYNSGSTLEMLIPEDPHIIISYHEYSGIWNPSNTVTWGSDSEKQSMDDLLMKVYDKFVNKGIPVVIGEIGSYLPDKRSNLANLKWYDYLLSRTYELGGITCMLWDDGGTHLRYPSLTWFNPLLPKLVVNAAKGIPNSFLSEDRIFVKAGEEQKNIKLNIIRNGNKLISIKEGFRYLVEGTDYKLDRTGTKLTLKGLAVSKLVRGNDLGYKTRLIFGFSQGISVPLDIVKYNTPKANVSVISIDPDNVKDDIVVPVDTNGLDVIRISAKKDNNSPAFSTWLEYENVKASFKNGNMIIKKEQLKSLTENVTYKFIFLPDTISLSIKVNVLKKNDIKD